MQRFQIPWEPTAKGRPFFLRTKGIAITPPRTRHAEAAIRDLLIEKGAVCYEKDVALSLTVVFYCARPESVKNRKYPAKRPDLENYLKLILDAANKVLWADDAQIVEIWARKVYTKRIPRQVLLVSEMEEADA